jgi:hypothetical protein
MQCRNTGLPGMQLRGARTGIDESYRSYCACRCSHAGRRIVTSNDAVAEHRESGSLGGYRLSDLLLIACGSDVFAILPIFYSSTSRNTSNLLSTMETIVTPRFHLLEIGDQSWCPEFLREYSHLIRMQMWRTKGQDARGKEATPADFACDVMLDNIPGLSDFTIVDPCAGGGGPIPILEPALNRKLRERSSPPVRFVMSDLWPSLERWTSIAKKSPNITYIAEPRDATKVGTLAEPGMKECRLYNLCFHHFDDDIAPLVLRSAVESSDAFV